MNAEPHPDQRRKVTLNGEITPDETAWWNEFGTALETAQRTMNFYQPLIDTFMAPRCRKM